MTNQYILDNKLEKIMVVILLFSVVFTTYVSIKLDTKNKELYKNIKKANKIVNKERLRTAELEQQLKDLVMVKIVPISFSNLMADYCDERIDNNLKCPFNQNDFNIIFKIESIFQSENITLY